MAGRRPADDAAMSETRMRRCSQVVLAVQAAWLAGTVAMRFVEPYLGLLGTLLQGALAALALGLALGCWLVARPRGSTLGWLCAMPAGGAVATVASFVLLATVRWG